MLMKLQMYKNNFRKKTEKRILYHETEVNINVINVILIERLDSVRIALFNNSRVY